MRKNELYADYCDFSNILETQRLEGSANKAKK
jgi:hypothetical protein